MTHVRAPSAAYQCAVAQLAQAMCERADDVFELVVVDGIPGGGKSSLTEALAGEVSALGRPCVVVENDWFIDHSIRNPLKLVAALAFALTSRHLERVERELLQRFLDSERLAHFQTQLHAAPARLRAGRSVKLSAQGAYWNLRRPGQWQRSRAAQGLDVQPGSTMFIEGTLTRATYIEGFPHLRSVFVHVPPIIARQRFLQRNRDPARERNLAFSALASRELPFRLASEMISRNRSAYEFEVNLERLEAPTWFARG